MDNVDDSNVQYIAFLNKDYDKHQQFAAISRVSSRCCVMCEGKKPQHTGYFEPNKKSGLKNPENTRIWYFICDHCVRVAEPMSIDNQILKHILSLKN
jgi:uncharacterized membrane protein